MSRRAVPESTAERNRNTLKQLVKLEANKSCSDCKRNKRMWHEEADMHMVGRPADWRYRSTMGKLEFGHLYLHKVGGDKYQGV
jgi:hypothetical protein